MEEANKNLYEISFLLESPDFMAEILAVLKRSGAEISSALSEKENIVKKINLAYKIKKRSEAYFGFLKFSAAPDAVSIITKELNLSDKVLRFLIISPPKIKEEPAKKVSPEKENKTAPEEKPVYAPSSGFEPSPEPEKISSLSNEALEKKLEEILG